MIQLTLEARSSCRFLSGTLEKDERPVICEPNRRRRRTVCFSDIVQVRESPEALPENKKERKRLWYRKKDYKIFIAQEKELAGQYRLAKKRNQDVSDLHVRGLEPQLTISMNTKVRQRITLAKASVLKEQARQKIDNEYNPAQLRAVSLCVTRPAQYMASLLAKEDELEAVDSHASNHTAVVDVPVKSNQILSNNVTSSPTTTIVTVDREARMIVLDCDLRQPFLF